MKSPLIPSESSYTIFRIIFFFCSIYFLLMGTGLVFFPYFIVKGIGGENIHPAIIGLLRGSGGAIIPYSVIYFLVAQKPLTRKWGLLIITIANLIAIILDTWSVLMHEYQPGYAMIDLPVELLSLAGVLIIWIKIRSEI